MTHDKVMKCQNISNSEDSETIQYIPGVVSPPLAFAVPLASVAQQSAFREST